MTVTSNLARRAAAIGIGAAVLSFAAGARADGADEAKELFARGRALRGSGQCAEAIPLFRKAYEAYPVGLGSVRNLAECEESLGHGAAAKRWWAELARDLTGNTESKYAGWADTAAESVARLAPRVGAIALDVVVTRPGGAPAERPDLQVTLDGDPVSASALGAALELDPGRHRVAARAREVGPAGPLSGAEEQEVDVTAGPPRRVTLAVHEAPEAPAAPAAALAATPPAPAAHAERHASPALDIVGGALAGVGAVAVGVAIYAAVDRQRALDDLISTCEPGLQHCDPGQKPAVYGLVDRGATDATLFNAFITVGAAGLAGAAALFTIPRLASRHGPGVAIGFSPGGVSFTERF